MANTNTTKTRTAAHAVNRGDDGNRKSTVESAVRLGHRGNGWVAIANGARKRHIAPAA